MDISLLQWSGIILFVMYAGFVVLGILGHVALVRMPILLFVSLIFAMIIFFGFGVDEVFYHYYPIWQSRVNILPTLVID